MRNEKEKLCQAVLIQNQSTTWFQDELLKTLTAIHKIESNPKDSNGFEYARLQNSLVYLMQKGLFEKKELNRLKALVEKI